MGVALVTKRIVNTCQREKCSAILVISFIVGDAAVLVVKLGTRLSTSVHRGEWAYHTHSEAFKHEARLQLHSKNFALKQLCNSFICKILKYKASFVLKLAQDFCIQIFCNGN